MIHSAYLRQRSNSSSSWDGYDVYNRGLIGFLDNVDSIFDWYCLQQQV